jgi:hypothetical protein
MWRTKRSPASFVFGRLDRLQERDAEEARLPLERLDRLGVDLGAGVEADVADETVGNLCPHQGFLEAAGRRHRRLALDRLAVASFDERTEARLRAWLSDEQLPREPTPPALEGRCERRVCP